jgi:cyanate lyase
VTVLVANATNTSGLAAHYTTALAAGGWDMKTPGDAATTVAASAVYYAAGQQEPAAAIAAALGLKPSAVLPLTTAVPVAGASGDDVVVVVGADLVSAASS